MCYVQIAMAAIAVVSSVVANRNAKKAAKNTAEAINEQARQRNEEISDQASVELNERAREIRRAKASARATASESGINLSSGSFLAQLATFDLNQDVNHGVIEKNAANKKKGTLVTAKSSLAGLQYKSGLGIATDAAMAGTSAYMGAGGTFGKGATSNLTPIFGQGG